jgi:hypothetical protein
VRGVVKQFLTSAEEVHKKGLAQWLKSIKKSSGP